MKEKIGLVSDHGGKILKHRILEYLRAQGFDVQDYGVDLQSPSVDYPDCMQKLAADVSSAKLKRGVAVCGTGIGMAITANKFPGVRASSVWDEFTAKATRQHNDSNIICLGERVINHDRALDYLKIWLDTEFEEGRHRTRLEKLGAIEQDVMGKKK
ncbi:MAG: ribose 5-phosphate isomerase B [Oligoflexales bacterium]